MARLYRELLTASRLLLARDAGRRGRLPGARIRRSISTTYYALFHFLIEESTARLAGKDARHLRRRRLLTRSFTHSGMRTAFQRLAGRALSSEFSEFLGRSTSTSGVPSFGAKTAEAFLDAQAQRHLADYNLNATLSEADAAYFADQLEVVIELWLAANAAEDEDFKHALALLLLRGGKLRGDDA